MGYKPTLGGLRIAQEFLCLMGFPLPVFQMDIFDDGENAELRWVPGKGQTIPIDEAIRKFGAKREVTNVRLANEQGDKFVVFSSLTHVGMFTAKDAMDHGWDVVLEFHQDHRFKNFMDSENGQVFLNLARWGKSWPTILDRIIFQLFPGYYASKVFADLTVERWLLPSWGPYR